MVSVHTTHFFSISLDLAVKLSYRLILITVKPVIVNYNQTDSLTDASASYAHG